MCASISARFHRGNRGVSRTGAGNCFAAESFQIVLVVTPSRSATCRTLKYSEDSFFGASVAIFDSMTKKPGHPSWPTQHMAVWAFLGQLSPYTRAEKPRKQHGSRVVAKILLVFSSLKTPYYFTIFARRLAAALRTLFSMRCWSTLPPHVLKMIPSLASPRICSSA